VCLSNRPTRGPSSQSPHTSVSLFLAPARRPRTVATPTLVREPTRQRIGQVLIFVELRPSSAPPVARQLSTDSSCSGFPLCQDHRPKKPQSLAASHRTAEVHRLGSGTTRVSARPSDLRPLPSRPPRHSLSLSLSLSTLTCLKPQVSTLQCPEVLSLSCSTPRSRATLSPGWPVGIDRAATPTAGPPATVSLPTTQSSGTALTRYSTTRSATLKEDFGHPALQFVLALPFRVLCVWLFVHLRSRALQQGRFARQSSRRSQSAFALSIAPIRCTYSVH